MKFKQSTLRASFAVFAVLGLGVSHVLAQTVIPASSARPASDGGQRGFLWRVHQGSATDTTLYRTENQLAGLLGENLADPNAPGVATGTGKAGATPNDPIEFQIDTVINMSQNGSDNAGNFQPDDTMPGIPGTGGSTDGIAGEVLTWIELPAGNTVLGVNSDDGFRVSIGGVAPADRFSINAGQFDGGRGAADTTFTVKVDQAGLYPARVIWNEGGGGANIEFFSQKADGTKVLVNDSANGGLRAFRTVSGAAKAMARKVSPGPNAADGDPSLPVTVELVDGASAIAAASVKLTVDGTAAPAATKAGNVTTVNFPPPGGFWTSGSTHAATLVYTEGSTSVTQSWNFTIQTYKVVPRTAKVNPDRSKAGFVWRVFQNEANQANSNARTEDALAGRLKNAEGNPLDNLADPAAQGAALAPGKAPSPSNAPVEFEIGTVINLSQTAGENNGSFGSDEQMPGIPGTGGNSDGIAAEIITYLELPAGATKMGVNSDDGFRTLSGNPRDAFDSIMLGEFEGGRGAADTVFTVVVEEAGVYPFRTTWEEGGGGANVEWFTVKPDGTKVLVGDTAKGGVAAFRATSEPVKPVVSSVNPPPAPRQMQAVGSSLTVELADGGTTINDASVVLEVDGKSTGVTKARSGSKVTVTYTPEGLQVPTDKHTAKLTYADSTGSSRTVSWTFYNLKNLVLPAPKILETFDTYPEDSQPTGWKAWNFTARCTEGRDITNQGSESYENWVLVSTGNLNSIDGGRPFNITAGQLYNGKEIKNGDPVGGSFPEWLMSGNVLYAESDSRCNGDTLTRGFSGQTQFIESKPFDLSGFTQGVVLTFSSIYEQNQDSYGGVEYSVDGGKTWLPIMYFLEQPDIVVNADGTVNATKTFTNANSDTSAWVENGVAKGGKYGDGVGAAISESLAAYITPRVNDDQVEGKRIEVARLPNAFGKSDVRLRFSAMGTDSWYFAIDNIAFYDVANPVTSTSSREYSIGLNVGSNEPGGSLAATDIAGVAAVAQGNWNNLGGGSGTNTTVVADANGKSESTSVTVTWASAGTWASTGRGEENNKLTGANKTLTTGYLDTGAATTTTLSVWGVPAKLTSTGYDVYVYAMGGVGGRGGAYRIVDAATGQILSDYVRAVSPTNLAEFVEVPYMGGTNPNGAQRYGVGNYIVFRGLTSPNITIQATTANSLGTSTTPRAPINAVQLVSPSLAGGLVDVTQPGDQVQPYVLNTPSVAADSPAAEAVANVIDNQASTKYLNFKKLNTGLVVTPRAGASVVTGLSLQSANDSPDRDPTSFKLEGSKDGTTFAVIAEGTVPAFTGRFNKQSVSFANTVEYSTYRLSFPTVANATAANSMQVAEIELLGKVVGPALPATISLAKAATGNNVVITYSGVLQSATTVTGPYTDVAGASSPFTAASGSGARFYRTRQ